MAVATAPSCIFGAKSRARAKVRRDERRQKQAEFVASLSWEDDQKAKAAAAQPAQPQAPAAPTRAANPGAHVDRDMRSERRR